MKDKIIFFLLGSIIGSVTTFVITKKYKDNEAEKNLRLEVDNRVNAEIEKFRADCKKAEEDDEKEESKPLVDSSNPTQKPDLMEYYKKTSKKYHNYSDYEGGNETEDDDILIIPASEIPYGIEDEIIRYKYWKDKTLTDSTDEPLTDKEIENSCGFTFEDFFGKDPEEPDIVYVKRGEKYYEITMDARDFEDTIK